MKKAMLFLVALLFSVTASAASLYDDFESESNTGSILNYNSFANWDVTNGTVDLKKTGEYGITCYDGSSYCVDLDGSTLNAGVLTSKEAFVAGYYEVSFAFSGNQRGNYINGSTNQSDEFTVEFTDGVNIVLQDVISFSQGWSVYTGYFLLSDLANIQFSVTGGDNQGVVLDNVSISAVPVPAAAFLFAPALLGLFGLRRKSQAVTA
jgi:hypothetical protein